MPDSVLDLLVWVLPFFPSLMGMLLTLEPLSQQSQRHKWKWRIGLAVFGATVSLITYVQQARQRAQSRSDIRELKEQALLQERESDQRAEELKKNFDVFVAESLRERRSTSIVIPKSPTAEEIAAELDKKLSARLNGAKPPNLTEEKSPVQAKPTPIPVQTPIDPPISRSCRNDHLNECSDEELLDRLRPLVTKILEIHEEYSAETKRLDDIKGGKLDWLRELSGVGGDKDSKWLKGLDLAGRKANDNFRDCCAESALLYHRELLQRYHEGSDNAELYEWVKSLLQLVGSKEWKKARDDRNKVANVYFDLHFYQIHLEYLVAVSHIPNRH